MDELPHTGDDLIDGLGDHDEEREVDRGEPMYPEDGPGAGYSPDKVRDILAGFRLELDKVRIAFVRFKLAQGFDWQLNIARQTTLTFLQANDEEALLRNKIDEEDKALHINEMSNLEARFDAEVENEQNVDNRSNHESETMLEDNSILNAGDQNNPEILIQEVADPPQGDRIVNEMPNLEARFDSNPEERRKASSCPPNFNGDIFNPRTKAQSSNKGSEAESSIQSIAGSRFQKTKKKLSDQVKALEDNKEIHTDALNEKIKRISKDFKAINFDSILEKFVYEPNCDEIHGGTAQELTEWHDDLESRIEHLQDLAEA